MRPRRPRTAARAGWLVPLAVVTSACATPSVDATALAQLARMPRGTRPGPPTTTEGTEALWRAVASVGLPLPAEASRTVVLLVPGIFTERYPGYMCPNERRLDDLGLRWERADIDTDASVIENAKALQRQILDATDDGTLAILLAHSKGGVDAAAAVALFPELRPRLAAVITVGAPHRGSPLAEDVVFNPWLGLMARNLVRFMFRGDPDALADLTFRSREAFERAHPYPSDVRTYCLASSLRLEGVDLTSPLAVLAAYVQHRCGQRSDGLVSVVDGLLPGSCAIGVDSLDHAGSTFQGFGRHPATLDPETLTEALLRLVWSEM